jgi:oxygen-dependent protoporphyrinogen oxidase
VSRTDVLIVGGGVSGLASAWWLARAGLAVEVWECARRAGGKIRTSNVSGYLNESAAALMLNYRPEVARLLTESGLSTLKATPLAGRRYLVHQNRLVPVPTRLGEMIASPLWSSGAKLRLLAEPFIPRGNREDESVSEFTTRRLGREPLEKAMEPYVAGALASDPDRASAGAALPRLTALERRFGSLAIGALVHRLQRRRRACPTESFSFMGGMSTLIEALTRAPGLRLRLGRTVNGLAPDGGEAWSVSGTSEQGTHVLRARHVVVSVPADVAASLLQPLDGELARLLSGIEYSPVCVIHFGFDRSAVRHPLNGTGFLTPREPRQPLNGVLWMSTLFPDRAPPGKVLLTCYLGGARAPHVVDWNDERVVAAALNRLRQLLGLSADPEMVQIYRHHQALPLYHGAYVERIKRIDTRLERLPALHLAANYVGGVSVRDRIACGCEVADRILSGAGRLPAPGGWAAAADRLCVLKGASI